MLDAAAIVASLAGDAPYDPVALVDGLVQRVTAAGVRLARLRVGLNTMHPDTFASTTPPSRSMRCSPTSARSATPTT